MALTKITGQVVDTTTDLVVGVTTVGGGVSAVDGFFSGIVTFSQGVSIGGTLTYEDVTNIDSVGIITARSDILVGSGITLSPDGDIFFTGIITGNGSGLTGVSGVSVANQLDNRVITNTGTTDALNAEANLVFTGTRLGLNQTSPAPLSGGGNGLIHIAASDNPEVVLERTASGTEAKASIRITDGEDFKIAVKDGSASIIDALTIDSGTGNITASGTVAATSYTGDGSSLTGISVGIATTAASMTGITTVLDLSKDDFKVTASGITTVDVRGGTEGNSHMLRIVNSGITTVGFSTYFLFPSGGTPNLPTTDGAISLISFTVHRQGAVGLATQLLAGASVNFS